MKDSAKKDVLRFLFIMISLEEIKTQNPVFAEALKKLVIAYRYDKIQSLLDQR